MRAKDYIHAILEVGKNKIKRTSFPKRNVTDIRAKSFYYVTLRKSLQLLLLFALGRMARKYVLGGNFQD